MTAPVREPSVYLAGPGVFRPDAKDFGAKLKEKCAAAGLIGFFPLDNELTGATPIEMAKAIYLANVNLINLADAIIADISPFRGPNMDAGTAWEIGYGAARGLPLFAWSSESELFLKRTQVHVGTHARDGRPVDKIGWMIEDFGLAENLMIAISCGCIYSNVDEAISACAEKLQREKKG